MTSKQIISTVLSRCAANRRADENENKNIGYTDFAHISLYYYLQGVGRVVRQGEDPSCRGWVQVGSTSSSIGFQIGLKPVERIPFYELLIKLLRQTLFIKNILLFCIIFKVYTKRTSALLQESVDWMIV